MLSDLFGSESRDPDFINEEGTKWWRQEITWGQSRNLAKTLEENKVAWFFVITEDEYKAHVVIHEDVIVHHSQQLEAVCCFLDAYAIAVGE